MAAKDLTVEMRVSGTDEIGRLGEAINTSVAAMRSVLVRRPGRGDALGRHHRDQRPRRQEAGNAHTQSSKTNQIAAAAQEMTATIGEISHNAESAAGASRVSAETAEPGRNRDAGRRHHHGKDCRGHQHGLQK
jgi:methyl-accepting chemotaxis protein